MMCLQCVYVFRSRQVSPYVSWLLSSSEVSVYIAPLTNDGLATVDVGGCLRLWETSVVNLERSLQEWRNMIGYRDDKPLEVGSLFLCLYICLSLSLSVSLSVSFFLSLSLSLSLIHLSSTSSDHCRREDL